MDHIDEKLTSDAVNHTKYEPSIRASLSLAKKTLNRYYDLTDASEVYRIAMGMLFKLCHLIMNIYEVFNPVLHPRHKLSYFKQAGWLADWINTAEDIVHTEFNRSYAIESDSADEQEVGDSGDVIMVHQSIFFFYFGILYNTFTLPKLKSKNIFDNFPSLTAPRWSELRDELDAFLGTDPESVVDMIKWWSEKHTTYPWLSRMALDYLTIPGKLRPRAALNLLNIFVC